MSYQLVDSDCIEELAPPVWRIRNVMPTIGLASIYGPSTAGKSFLALDMAAAIASGGSWFGHRVRSAPVVYVALEGEAGFRLRVKAWKSYHSEPMPPELYFVILQPFKITNPLNVADLAAACPKGCVLIIDTLNRSAPTANENESRDMGLILEGAKRLQSLTEGLVVLIHHTGKDESRGLRGHSSLLAAMDATIEVSRLNEQREWTVAKSKDGMDGQSFGFRLHIEELEVDEFGESVTSCAIEPAGDAKANAAPQPQGKIQRAIWEALRALLASSGHVGYPGVPNGIFAIPLSSAIQCAAEQLVEVESHRRAHKAKEAIAGLVKRGALGSTTEFIWRMS